MTGSSIHVDGPTDRTPVAGVALAHLRMGVRGGGDKQSMRGKESSGDHRLENSEAHTPFLSRSVSILIILPLPSTRRRA